MARMKIEFLAEYKRRNGFTRRDKLIAHLPRYSPWLAPLQPLISVANRLPGAGALIEAVTGFDRRRPLPKWRKSWLSEFKARGVVAKHRHDQTVHEARDVVLFADTFNNWFEPENLSAALKVLEATGHNVITVNGPDGRALCCGRTYLSAGMVDEARAEARRTLAALAPYLEKGTPVVGLEPSCLFTFRDEYSVMFPSERIARLLATAQLADQYLMGEIKAGRIAAPWHKTPGAPIRVHGHCHQKAFGAFDATIALLKTIPGAQVEAIESSCCGMAGSFGHEHYEVSMKMGEAALLPAVRAAASATIVAAGTSCRGQIAHGAQRDARHPLAILAAAL
jgi:Fe-S oxidoreductase